MHNSKIVALPLVQSEKTPFPHFTCETVFNDGTDRAILAWLQESINWDLTKTDFYTQYEFSLLDFNLPEEVKFLVSKDVTEAIISSFSTAFGVSKLVLVGVTAHKLMNGHRIGIHNDFIGNEESHRLIIQFTPDWKEENGGYLMLFGSSEASDVYKIIKPLNNTGLAFEISASSFHAVSTINNYSRYTLVYTFKKVE